MTKRSRKLFSEFRDLVFPQALQNAVSAGQVVSRKLDELTLLRFLRAEKFQPEKAAHRLISTIEWWHKQSVDTSLTNPPACIAQYHQLRVQKVLGLDYEGRAVLFERLGEFLGSDINRALPFAAWMECYTHDIVNIYEWLRESSRERQRPIERLTYVGDLTGLNLLQSLANMSLLKAFVQVVEVHFPEMAGPLVLMNAPKFLASVFPIAKRFLDPVVVSKIEIHDKIPTKKTVVTDSSSCSPKRVWWYFQL